jgi:L-ribulose-5-phosphate 3-epimerase
MQYGIVESALGPDRDARFALAREMGFDGVELMFSALDYEQLHLWTIPGAARVRRLATDAGVALPSVCATYFNWYGFVSDDAAVRRQSLDVLHRLCETAAEAGLRTILIPCFGAGEICSGNATHHARIVEALAACADHAEARELILGLEATLPAQELIELVRQVDHPAVQVYFDTGNVVPVGYDPAQELLALGPYLCQVHMKDRRRDGETVALGSGDVDFSAVARALHTLRYDGWLVLETPGGQDYCHAAAQNLHVIRRIVTEIMDVPDPGLSSTEEQRHG